MNNNKNILFYSNFCEYCKEFNNEINNLNIKFIGICVDGNRNLPNYVKSVPTIAVNNNIITGDNVFKWLENIKSVSHTNSGQQANQNMGQQMNQNMGQQMNQNMGQQMNQNMGQQVNQNMGQQMNQNMGQQVNQNMGQQVNQNMGQPVNQTSQKAPINDDNILAWHANEMGSAYSDSFSFLDSKDTNEGQPLSHNFEFLGNISDAKINTPQEDSFNSSKDKGMSDYEKLMSDRDTQPYVNTIQRI